MQVGLRSKNLWRQTLRGAQRLVPRPILTSWESRILATAWTLAALTTLTVAFAQSLQMFLLCALAVLFGTLTALPMLNGLARRR